jgi:hypothetical protein
VPNGLSVLSRFGLVPHPDNTRPLNRCGQLLRDSIKTASNPAVVPRGQKDDIHCQASASQQGDLRAEETAFDLTPARLPSYNISATTKDNLELRNAATLN